ncbi:MAG: hypothetical protein U0234_16960 [Sandaracinus sp.]
MRLLLPFGMALLFGCTSPSSLAVQLVSNLTPRRDVDAVHVEVRAGASVVHDERLALESGASLGRPRRLVDLADLAPGEYRVVVTLEHAGARVLDRSLRVQVSGATVRTISLTRDCLATTCGADQTCADGTCVDPICADEHPEACAPPECEVDADCTSTAASCAPTRCSPSGACESLPDDARCPATAPVCDATLGCLAASDPSPLALTLSAAPGARAAMISATAPGATHTWVGLSATRLAAPDAAAVQALAQCSEDASAVDCLRGMLEPLTTYWAYAVALRATASGDTLSDVAEAQVTTTDETRVVDLTSGGSLAHALLWTPDAAATDTTGATFPLILFLHGGGEMTTTDPLAIRTGDGLLRSLLTDHAMSAAFPFFVVAPHCTDSAACGGWPATITLPMDTLDALRAMGLPVDWRRVYVTGLSFGGEGSIRFASLHPDVVAAAVPIASTTWTAMPTLCDAATVPMWMFHGAMDTFWAPSSSQGYLSGLRACPNGSATRQELTLLDCTTPGSSTNHCGWDETYGGMIGGASFEGQTDVFAWMLTHSL